jgi:hypothetical protein
MKRTLWIVPLLFLTGTALAQLPSGVSVTLSANPANAVQGGTAVILTATVHTPGKGILMPGATRSTHYNRERLRFTYKAQRSWPCAESSPATLAENVPATGGTATPVEATYTSTSSWTPQAAKAGEYTFSVDVVYLTVSIVKVLGQPPSKLTAEKVGSATLNYKVTPPSGFSNYVKTDFSPSSPTTAPVSLYFGVSIINNPPEGRWYRYQYWCSGGCQPGTGKKDSQPASTSFQMAIPNPGQYTFSIGVDKVRQSDCVWEQSIVTHSDPYYYTVNRAP